MKYLALSALALGLAACDMMGMPGATPPPPSPERMEAFVVLVEGSGCELHQSDNQVVLDTLGFTDAEASALSRRLIAEGRAEVTPEGNLVLLTENCV